MGDPSNLPCLGEALDSPPEQGESEGGRSEV